MDYELFDISGIEKVNKDSFNFLPDDEYLKSEKKFRKRRYSTGVVFGKNIDWNNDKEEDYYQSKRNNNYAGGVLRRYHSLENDMKNFISEHIMFSITNKLPKNEYKIRTHQIRVVTDNENLGLPAPEGVHQDGFDHICMMLVDNHNVSGGNSIITNSIEGNNIIFDRILQPKDCLLVDDRKLFHYVSPIVPKLPGYGHRDVIIITFENM